MRIFKTFLVKRGTKIDMRMKTLCKKSYIRNFISRCTGRINPKSHISLHVHSRRGGALLLPPLKSAQTSLTGGVNPSPTLLSYIYVMDKAPAVPVRIRPQTRRCLLRGIWAFR